MMPMSKRYCRRFFLKSAALVFAPYVVRAQTSARAKTLRIMRWKNFVPAYETWFNEVFVRRWGEDNDTEVLVSNVGLGEIGQRAEREIEAKEGHDLVLFLSPKPSFEDHTIDHRDIHQECVSRFGNAHAFVGKSNVNPRTGAYHGFIESFAPTLLTYRKDIWDNIGAAPASWDDIRRAGRAARLLHDAPVGISLGPEHNAEHTLRAMLATFGSSVQDAENAPALASPNTLEALKFAKALYEEAMFPGVADWRSTANNLEVLAGNVSLTVDTMSIIRAAEAKALPIEPDLALAPLPEGPLGRGGPAFATNTYIIWKFAQNIDGAKQFLVDFTTAFGEGLAHSGFQSMPSYPGSVPELADRLKTPHRPGRYDLLLDLPASLTNLGHPGHSNAATDEVLQQRIMSRMFRSVAIGEASPEEAMANAAAAIDPIFRKWRDAGKI